MSIAERLKIVLERAKSEHPKIGHAEFVMTIGMPIDRFKNLLSNKLKKLTEAEARQIGKVHGFHELWLLTGRGPMQPTKDESTIQNAALQMIEAGNDVAAMGIRPELRDVAQRLLFYVARRDGDGLQALLESSATNPDTHASTETALIAFYDVHASAGNGSAVSAEDVICQFAVRKDWLSRKGLKASDLSMISARGDSMEPTIRDGDMLMVDRNVSRLVGDGIYLVERDNDLYCKRLQKRFEGGVTIMSDNEKYKPQQLTAQAATELNVVGRVIWVGGER